MKSLSSVTTTNNSHKITVEENKDFIRITINDGITQEEIKILYDKITSQLVTTAPTKVIPL